MNLLILAKSILSILFLFYLLLYLFVFILYLFIVIIVVLYFQCAGYCYTRKLLIFVYLFFNFTLCQASLLFIIVFHSLSWPLQKDEDILLVSRSMLQKDYSLGKTGVGEVGGSE